MAVCNTTPKTSKCASRAGKMHYKNARTCIPANCPKRLFYRNLLCPHPPHPLLPACYTKGPMAVEGFINLLRLDISAMIWCEAPLQKVFRNPNASIDGSEHFHSGLPGRQKKRAEHRTARCPQHGFESKNNNDVNLQRVKKEASTCVSR